MRMAVQEILNHLHGRVHGPLSFRLILQPMVAAVYALLAGLRDARAGRPAYGWAVITDRGQRIKLLRQCWHDMATVFIFAVLIDFIYELIVFRKLYPVESLFVAAVLALCPYLLIRGPVNRAMCLWHRIHKRHQPGR
jgi:hypothetical protein